MGVLGAILRGVIVSILGGLFNLISGWLLRRRLEQAETQNAQLQQQASSINTSHEAEQEINAAGQAVSSEPIPDPQGQIDELKDFGR